MTSKRRRRLVLLAVTAGVAGILIAYASRRKRAARPVRAETAAAGKTAAERPPPRPAKRRHPWVPAVFALAGTAVILSGLVAVKNRIDERRRTEATDRATAVLGAPRRVPEILSLVTVHVDRPDTRTFGPVAMGQVLTVTGDPGFAAQLLAVRAKDALSYAVQVRNVGTEPFDGSLTSGVWLYAFEYPPVPPAEGRLLGSDGVADSRITPGREVSQVVSFVQPGPLDELRITLRLGNYDSTAVWTAAA
ncbi:hypothetical protein [Actinoplanes sp. NPDC051411]|uniref:hypothetical protein n=1 Tax=Actinoplanes sp. NPDC051411 TaxID=3155522 RepID=UPI0034347401